VVTIGALLGSLPYIALQLKSIITTFDLITEPAVGGLAGPVTALGMIVFTIVLGVRRFSPAERQPGIVAAVALGSAIKLLAFLLVGVVVTLNSFQGIEDFIQTLPATGFSLRSGMHPGPGPGAMTWMTYTLLAMSAIVFLPRQFHLTVIENFDENHIRSARWQFPLYLLLINVFVVPIALAALKQGLPREQADAFVLLLPLAAKQDWLALLVFLGGFTAASSMIVISSMTLSTMVTTQLLLPLASIVPALSPIRRRLLQCRWVAVAALIAGGYLVERALHSSLLLVDIGIMSFVAVFQFAPPVLAGLFWSRGSKNGAFAGLSAGFFVWLYTLVLPAAIKNGWLNSNLLETGPWGIAWLRPEQLFGLSGLDPVTHCVLVSMAVNFAAYLLGSLLFPPSQEARSLTQEFMFSGKNLLALLHGRSLQASIPMEGKRQALVQLFARYYAEADANNLARECLQAADLEDAPVISVVQLSALAGEAERRLSAIVGVAAARRAVKAVRLFSADETRELSQVYAEFLARLNVPPEELAQRMDFYQERAALLEKHALELKATIAAREKEIAERKLAEQALQEAEQRYRSIFENAVEGIFLIDRQGRLCNANPAMARLLGYDSPAELMNLNGDSPGLFYVDPAQHAQLIGQLSQAERVSGFETEWRCRDESPLWVSINAHVMVAGPDGPELIEGTVENITQRRASEALDKARRAAEAASEAKSAFLARMSHEIRTPLHAILGLADLLWESGLNAEQRKLVEVFRKAGDNLLVLVNEILDFARIESGRIEIESIPFSLREVVDNACSAMSSIAMEKKLSLSCHVAPNLPPRLVGDPTKLHQILINLLSNAIKFTGSGQVVLHVEIPTEETSSAGQLLFLVWDTGIGIPPDKLNIIFDSFSQADSSTTRNYGGSGLGLAICKRLVESMGGRIWVESTPGQGSMFFFTIHFELPDAQSLPQVSPSAEAASPGPGPVPDTPSRILLADDAENNRLLVRYYLKEIPHTLAVAENGAQAVQLFKSQPFDIVLMDMEMPVMDGYAAARAIRDWETAQGQCPTPIVALTAHAFQSAKEQCLAAGCSDYLSKPVKKQKFLETLLSILRKSASAAIVLTTETSDAQTYQPDSWEITVDAELEELVPEFIQITRRDIETMNTALRAGEFETVRRLGHSLKGAGGGYGFDFLGRMGLTIEKAAKAGDAGTAGRAIASASLFLDRARITYVQE